MNTSKNSFSRKKSGFTLVEVATSLTLLSIAVLPIITMVLFIMNQSYSGLRRTSASARALNFQQFFIKEINSARHVNVWEKNIVAYEVYDEKTESWKEASFSYVTNDTGKILYAPPGEKDPTRFKTVVEGVQPKSYGYPLFREKSKGVDCNLFFLGAGLKEVHTLWGLCIDDGVHLQLTATPRNK